MHIFSDHKIILTFQLRFMGGKFIHFRKLFLSSNSTDVISNYVVVMGHTPNSFGDSKEHCVLFSGFTTHNINRLFILL